MELGGRSCQKAIVAPGAFHLRLFWGPQMTEVIGPLLETHQRKLKEESEMLARGSWGLFPGVLARRSSSPRRCRTRRPHMKLRGNMPWER